MKLQLLIRLVFIFLLLASGSLWGSSADIQFEAPKGEACSALLEAVRNETWVTLGNKRARGVYQCQHCAGLVVVSATTEGQISCPGCGHPFDGREQDFAPPRIKNADGTFSVPASFVIGGGELQFFAGEHWVCMNCETRNPAIQSQCTNCGTPKKSGMNLGVFQSLLVKNLSPLTHHFPPKTESSKVSASPVTETMVKKGTRSWLGASIAAMVITGSGFWAHSALSPHGPLVGEITEKTGQVLVFPNQEIYQALKRDPVLILDSQNGVKTLTPEVARSWSFSRDQVVVQQLRVTISVNGQTLSFDVSSAQFQSLKIGDQVTITTSDLSEFQLE